MTQLETWLVGVSERLSKATPKVSGCDCTSCERIEKLREALAFKADLALSVKVIREYQSWLECYCTEKGILQDRCKSRECDAYACFQRIDDLVGEGKEK